MNYYEHHLGDYAQATQHLSMLEDAAYSRMLRWYYAEEKPLPSDARAVCRIVRAMSKAERDAVSTVLAEFFEQRDDGYHQDRCDEEIARYREGEPEREAKRANEDARLKRHREERARLFKVITDAGQHVAWNIGMNELRAVAARVAGASPDTLPATAPATPATATQTPDTRHQAPDTRVGIPSGGVPPAASAAPPTLFAIATPEPKPLTARERVWAIGVPLLGESGRSHLGKLAKTYGEELLAAVLAEAMGDPPADPKAWVTAACERRKNAAPARANGHGPSDPLGEEEASPKWATDAGFGTRWEANNEGCYRHNAAQFKDGRKVEKAEAP